MTITLYSRTRNGRLSYYTLHDRQPSLDGSPVLTSAWRIEGGRERELHRTFASGKERDRALRRLFTAAVRRGYRLLYSFDRAGIGRFGTGAESLAAGIVPGAIASREATRAVSDA